MFSLLLLSLLLLTGVSHPVGLTQGLSNLLGCPEMRRCTVVDRFHSRLTGRQTHWLYPACFVWEGVARRLSDASRSDGPRTGVCSRQSRRRSVGT